MAVARLLLERRAAVDQARHCGATPLLVAAEKGHTDIVRLLLGERATVDGAPEFPSTPLLMACCHCHSAQAFVPPLLSCLFKKAFF